MKRLLSLSRSLVFFFSLRTTSLSLFSGNPHILPSLLAAFTITIMNVEDMELFMASQSASKTWRGRCMWAFEDGGVPALRFGEGVDLISERSVRVKFQALLSKKDGSYSYSRQHSLGYPIPTLHSPDPSNWPSLKVILHSISPILSCSASYFFFSVFLTFFYDVPTLLHFDRGISVTAFGLVDR
jgi:hypothetical protein